MAQQVLIVDDDRDLSFMVTEILKQKGYDVLTAFDGAEGLRILKSHTPQLMIVDLTMPVMSGWHFTTKVRQDERFKTTPIIVTSSLLEGETKPEQYESANMYIGKPYDIFELVAKIDSFLKA